MNSQTTLTTSRLVLRPFQPSDASDIQRLAGDREIAATTGRIPHPYPDGAAEEWIGGMKSRLDKGEVAFAITRAEDGALLGSIGLEINSANECAELGYWIGRPYWGNGYCTEAAHAILDYAFDALGLNRIEAHHFAGNDASGRVMQKIGMTLEGRLVQKVKKWGKFVDVIIYGRVRTPQ